MMILKYIVFRYTYNCLICNKFKLSFGKNDCMHKLQKYIGI